MSNVMIFVTAFFCVSMTAIKNVSSASSYSHRRRRLLDTDVLNLHTYDEYDWFLFAFAICLLCLLSFCMGWLSHRKYVANKIVEDDEIEDMKTPISPSAKSAGYENTHMTFNGFNIFGDKLQATPIPSRKKVVSATTSSQDTQSAVSEFEVAAVDQCNMHLHHQANIVEISSSSQPNMPSTSKLGGKRISGVSLSMDVSPVPSAVHKVTLPSLPDNSADVAETSDHNYQPRPPPEPDHDDMDIEQTAADFVRVISNPDPQQKAEIPKIIIPSKSAALIPKYKDIKTPQTAGIASPDSMEASQSHLSMEISVADQRPNMLSKAGKDTIDEDAEMEHYQVDDVDDPPMSPIGSVEAAMNGAEEASYSESLADRKEVSPDSPPLGVISEASEHSPIKFRERKWKSVPLQPAIEDSAVESKVKRMIDLTT